MASRFTVTAAETILVIASYLLYNTYYTMIMLLAVEDTLTASK